MKPKHLLFATVITLFIAAYFLYQDLLSIDTAKNLYPNFSEMTKGYLMHLAFVFCLTFILAVFLCLPITAALSVIAGIIFPDPYGMIYIILSVTVGSLFFYEWISYLCSPYGCQEQSQRLDRIQKWITPYISPLERRFKKRPWAYLLLFRMIPLFPSWIINMAPAVFKVRFNTFAWTTLIGIIPTAYFFTRAGMGIHSGLSAEGQAEIIHFLSEEMLLSATGIFLIITLTMTLKSRYKADGKETL